MWQLEELNGDEKIDQDNDIPGYFKRAWFEHQQLKEGPWEMNVAFDNFYKKGLLYNPAAQAKQEVKDVLSAIRWFCQKVYFLPSQHWSNPLFILKISKQLQI